MPTPEDSMMSGQSVEANLADADESLLALLLQELTDAWRQGQQPDLERLASLHPRLNADLRSLWATVWIAEEMARNGFGACEFGEARKDGPNTAAWPPATEAAAPAIASQPTMIGPVRRRAVLATMSSSKSWDAAAWGSCLRAREIARGRIVALKRLLRGPASTPQDLERFRIETLAAARLAHPHIVPVFQVGECDGHPYFTMQYIEGTTLAHATGRRPNVRARCRAALGAGLPCDPLRPRSWRPAPRLEAVEHPDRSPGKPLCQRFRPGQADRRGSHAHTLRGISGYAELHAAGAGRQHRAGAARSFGGYRRRLQLGAILYHMLTGRPPFQAATPIETMLLALEHDPIAPRALNPRVNPDLEMVALKCLQKPPSLRYPSAAALADDLESFLRGDAVSARSTSLRGLAARLMGETHHAAVLENWGLLWIYHSVALLVFFGTTNCALPRRRHSTLAICIDLHCRALRLGGALLGAAPPRRPDPLCRTPTRPRLGCRNRLDQPDLPGRVAAGLARCSSSPR